MAQNRRVFLKSLATVAATSSLSCQTNTKSQDTGSFEATPLRPPEPEIWSPAGEEDDELFPLGVQVGDVSEDSAIVSVQSNASVIEIRLMIAEDDVWAPFKSLLDVQVIGGFAQVVLSELPPDVAFCVAAFAPQTTGRSSVTRFRTAINSDGWRVFQFGVTSCLGGNLPWPNLSAVADYHLDFFAFLGDSVYADGSVSAEQYWANWQRTLSQQGMRDLTSSTSVVATWDDHEVDNNWSWNSTSQINDKYANGLAMFRRAFPQQYGSQGSGLWRKISWGAVADVFVLDCRGERQSGQYISDEQLLWLIEGLTESTARFKFILNSVPIIDYTNLLGGNEADDRWQGYPEQRSQLLGHIENNGIEGVLFLSGDFHFAQHARVSPPGEVGDTLFEVLCGPGGSFLNPIGDLAVETEQFLWSMSAWNSAVITADPGTGEVHVAFIGDDGGSLHELSMML